MTSPIKISDLVASFLIIALSFMVNKLEDNSQIGTVVPTKRNGDIILCLQFSVKY